MERERDVMWEDNGREEWGKGRVGEKGKRRY